MVKKKNETDTKKKKAQLQSLHRLALRRYCFAGARSLQFRNDGNNQSSASFACARSSVPSFLRVVDKEIATRPNNEIGDGEKGDRYTDEEEGAAAQLALLSRELIVSLEHEEVCRFEIRSAISRIRHLSMYSTLRTRAKLGTFVPARSKQTA